MAPILIGLLAETWVEVGVAFAALACLVVGLHWLANRRFTYERRIRLRGTPTDVRTVVEETVARALRARGTGRPRDDHFSIAVWDEAVQTPHLLVFELVPDDGAVEVRIRSTGVIFNPAVPAIHFNRQVARARWDAIEKLTGALAAHDTAA